MVVGFLCLTVCMTFVAYGVDIGYITLTRTRLQNAVDAAALAAAQEITSVVEDAPPGMTGEEITEWARDMAAAKAVEVAGLNGIYVDDAVDVKFGKRTYDYQTEEWAIEWDTLPANCVKVIARKDNNDPNAPDAKLDLFFAGVAGRDTISMSADAIAYVQPRDMVIVHDFSRSMNFDSYYSNEVSTRLTRSQLANYALVVWDDLGLEIEDFPRIPEYLEFTQSLSDVTTTVKFKYDDCIVTSATPITSVKADYSSGSQTWNNPTSGSNLNGSSNITKVTVTHPNPTLTTATISTNGITTTFTTNRLTYNITGSTRKLVYVDVYYEDGSYLRRTMSSNVYNYSKTESKAVDYLRIRSTNSSGNNAQWNDFNPPNTTVILTFNDDNAKVMSVFGLNAYSWPYPSGSWDGYINFCRTYSELRDDDADASDTEYREKYGGLTLVNYILRNHSGGWQCPDIWKTRHYPFHAIKEGHMLLCDFLEGLGFDDQLGMVSYDTNHRKELTMSKFDPDLDETVSVNIASDPISTDYTALRNLMKYKQAANYSQSTNMGGGLLDGVSMLDDSSRVGSRPTIILMTDGNTNTIDAGVDTSLPADWDWDALFDYDGDGAGDYYTSSTQKQYCLKLAYEAYTKDYTIHTMSVGADGDFALMEAIAHLGKGHYINVPGGSSVSEMQEEVEAAFHKIATLVPPARLMNDPNEQ